MVRKSIFMRIMRHHQRGRENTDEVTWIETTLCLVFLVCRGCVMCGTWVCLGSENALLLQEVLRYLRPGTRCVARDGFARFLLPRGFGVAQTRQRTAVVPEPIGRLLVSMHHLLLVDVRDGLSRGAHDAAHGGNLLGWVRGALIHSPKTHPPKTHPLGGAPESSCVVVFRMLPSRLRRLRCCHCARNGCRKSATLVQRHFVS